MKAKSIAICIMKSLILLVVVVCVVVANVQADLIQEVLGNALSECKEKVQATPDDILELLHHKPLTTTPAKCLVACMLKKFKIQKASGEFDEKALKETFKLAKFVSEDIYQQLLGIADICLGQVHKGDNECDIAYSIFLCAINEASAAKLPMILADIMI